MATYNGLVSSKTYNGQTYSGTTGGSLAGDSAGYSTINGNVPAKYFQCGQFALQTVSAISSTIGCYVVGAVGGATYIIAGRSNISTVGGFPLPLYNYVGLSGGAGEYSGFPRPSYVQFWNHKADVACFTAHVFMAAEYS